MVDIYFNIGVGREVERENFRERLNGLGGFKRPKIAILFCDVEFHSCACRCIDNHRCGNSNIY
jgi:hypothetical protein